MRLCCIKSVHLVEDETLRTYCGRNVGSDDMYDEPRYIPSELPICENCRTILRTRLCDSSEV